MSIEDRATQLAVAVIAQRAATTAAQAVEVYREILAGLQSPAADFTKPVNHRQPDVPA